MGTNFVISAIPQMEKEENRNAAESQKVYRDETMAASVNATAC